MGSLFWMDGIECLGYVDLGDGKKVTEQIGGSNFLLQCCPRLRCRLPLPSQTTPSATPKRIGSCPIGDNADADVGAMIESAIGEAINMDML